MGYWGWCLVPWPCALATKASHQWHATGHSKGACWFLCCKAPLCAEGTNERGRRRWPRGKWWSRGPSVAGEAGSDPRGHLWVTWGVYLCAGKPPLADIILSHPPDLTRCDSVIGLAIPAMSGHIQY